MKKKYVDTVHMREVLESKFAFEFNEKLNSYIFLKHILKMTKPVNKFVNGKKFCFLNEGYSLLEYSPLDESYNVRVFINDKDEILMYYIDMVATTGITKTNVPFYFDLYLDVLLYMPIATGASRYIHLDDESEIYAALHENKISKDDFNKAYEIAVKVMNEITDGTNRFVNQGNIDAKRLKQQFL